MPSSFADEKTNIPMNTVRVFDPAMCCSTGICGPSIDPQLVRFAADLDCLKTLRGDPPTARAQVKPRS
jgi:Arsenical resistance operon protein ArsD